MPTFNKTLNSNEIFGSIANMIISQQVFSDNIQHNQTLVDKARVDGGLYGDTKLYYATDVLRSLAWGGDSSNNILETFRPEDPSCQAIELNVFRQICLTVDSYLSKRAWSTEGAFSSFNAVMLGWMKDTKRVYDGTLYNTFIGTTVSTVGKQSPTALTLTDGKEGQEIAESLANLLVEMGDYSRDFNDYGYLRSYAKENIKVIWNSKWVNKIKKLDLPTLFHKEGLVDKFDEEVMPARYFGTIGTAAVTKANNDGTKRSAIEADYATAAGAVVTHVFPGDLIPTGTVRATAVKKSTATSGATQGKYVAVTVNADTSAIDANTYYIEDSKVICKVLVKLPPYMSAFEVATSFFNSRALNENHYLTFGHNTLEYLKNYPFITIKSN